MDIAPDRRMVKIKARVYPNKIAICMIAEPPEDNFARAFVNIVENIPKARIMNKP